MRGVVLAVLVMCAGPVLAEDNWRKLTTEAEAREAIEDRFLTFQFSQQWFYKSGKTLSDTGRPSWGNWRPQGGQYCSEWPPSSVWTCYDLYLNADASKLRFDGPGGDSTVGTYGPFEP